MSPPENHPRVSGKGHYKSENLEGRKPVAFNYDPIIINENSELGYSWRYFDGHPVKTCHERTISLNCRNDQAPIVI